MEHIGKTLTVTVELHLEEHEQITRDFMPLHYKQAGRSPSPYIPWNWSRVQKAVFAFLLPLIFKWKKSKIGTCKFTFSDAGLTRHSDIGAASRSWDQILSVHRLSTAYLIQLKEGGAMPIPYRAFGAEERSLFDSFAANVAH